MRLFLLLLFPLISQAADFIESVHAQGADIAKEMVVDGSQVVWSPFSVVNVLPLINGDESLKKGFQNSIEYFKESVGVQVSRLSSAYVKDKAKLSTLAAEYGVDVADLPEDKDIGKVLTEKYKEQLGIEAPLGLLPETLANTSQLFLTSLLVKAEWKTPFKYSPKSRFYLNETHALKTRYMSNIGNYKYGKIEEVDAKVLAIPFKNTTTSFLLVVLPNNSSALSTVSQQFAEVRVGTILEKLNNKRTQLTLPRISVDSQLLLQPMMSVKIVQSGSLRFTYSGLDNRVSKLKKTTSKFLRSRASKQDLKFVVNRPFLYLIFDTKAGVLNYGEVLLPSDIPSQHFSFKSESDKKGLKLTQNAKSLSDTNNELGYNLYQNLRNKLETFALSPIALANLLASFSALTNVETQQQFFSTLNSKAGMMELYQNIDYFNTTSSNATRISTKDISALEKVQDLGTKFVVDPEGKTQGFSEYNYEVTLPANRVYMKNFYRNERDHQNVSFYEYQGRVKYTGLPFWDAKAVLIFVSPTQSLLLFIPNERSGLHLIEEGLKEFAVAKLLCQMRDRFVRIRIPTFDVMSSSDLLPSLKEVLGIQDIKLDAVGGANVDAVTQTVRVQVGGKIPEAETRLRYGFGKYGNRRRPSTRLTVDRPFVFHLLDSGVGTLAVGRVFNVPDLKIVEESPVAEPEKAVV